MRQDVATPTTLADRSPADRPLLARQWHWLVSFVRKKPLPAACGVIVLILLAAGIFADAVAPYRYNERTPERRVTWSLDHPMGTDNLGQDMLSRVIYGARVSVIVGFGTIAVSQFIAVVVGATSGYFGSWTDTLVQRLVDIGQAFPGLVFIISIVSLFEDRGMLQIIIPLGIVFSFGASRIVRGAVIATRQNQYVEAAQALGAGHGRILIRHILPNVVPVIIVGATVQLGSAILIEASLSFLGYGVPEPPSWGALLNDARNRLFSLPHLAIWPSVVVFVAVYAFNMLGDGLRDVLDPRLRGTR